MILTILYLVSALDALSFSMTITVFGTYFYSLGGSHFYLGTIGSVTCFINLIWNPIVGSLSDRLGRKPVLLQCFLVCLIGNFLVTCTTSLGVLFFSRILTALGSQIVTLIKSFVDDEVNTHDEKISVFNKMQALGGLNFIIGSLLSGYLSVYDNGIKYIFYIISLTFLINIGLICFIQEKPIMVENKKDKIKFNVFKELKQAAISLKNIDWPTYWDIFIVKLMIDFTLNIFNFNFGLVLIETFGMDGKVMGQLFALFGIVGILTNFIMIKLKNNFYKNDKNGLQRLLHGSILLFVTFLGAGSAINFEIFVLSLIPMSIARPLLDTTLTEVILSRAKSGEKGSILGTFESTIPLTGLVSPLVSGVLSDIWSINMCMLLCSIPNLLAVCIIYNRKHKDKDQ